MTPTDFAGNNIGMVAMVADGDQHLMDGKHRDDLGVRQSILIDPKTQELTWRKR